MGLVHWQRLDDSVGEFDQQKLCALHQVSVYFFRWCQKLAESIENICCAYAFIKKKKKKNYIRYAGSFKLGIIITYIELFTFHTGFVDFD